MKPSHNLKFNYKIKNINKTADALMKTFYQIGLMYFRVVNRK